METVWVWFERVSRFFRSDIWECCKQLIHIVLFLALIVGFVEWGSGYM